ncbi:hypothetical protein ACHAWF_004094 [Thalassiosira exigua]
MFAPKSLAVRKLKFPTSDNANGRRHSGIKILNTLSKKKLQEENKRLKERLRREGIELDGGVGNGNVDQDEGV